MPTAKLILFDLDGTLYLDGVLYPGVIELIEKLKNENKLYGFLTNNSSIAPDDYLQKLQKLGLPTEAYNIVTSCEASSLMLKKMQIGPEIYVLGTKKFRDFMESEGFIHSYEKAKALLIGFDMELTYEKLTEATRLTIKGVPLFASHPDPICPGDLPDAGMLIEYLKAAKPGTIIQAIAGKPHHWLVELLEDRFQVKRNEIIMVGDRVGTDMKFAQNFGMTSILVLNGREQPPLGDVKPDLILPNIAELADKYWPWN